MNNFIELRQILRALLKSCGLRLFVLWPVLVIGCILSINQLPVYAATTSIMIGHALEATNIDRTDLQTSEQLTPTYVDLIRRRRILQAVVDKLNLPITWQALSKRVHVQPVDSTQLIEITADASSPLAAVLIADEIARQLSLLNPNTQNSETAQEAKQFATNRMNSLRTNIATAQQRVEALDAIMAATPMTATFQVRQLQTEIDTLDKLIVDWDTAYAQLLSAVNARPATNQITIIDEAQPQLTPVAPRVEFNVFLAALIGLFLATGLVFLLEYLLDTFQEGDNVDQLLGLPSLGLVSRIKGRRLHERLLAQYAVFSQPSEEYRRLRSKLQALSDNWTHKVIMVTSPQYDEGKSVTAANLGIVMAEAGLNVVIVDANLRRPIQHQLFQIANTKGLTTVLLAPTFEFSDCLYRTNHRNLRVLPAGGQPDYPSEVLGSARMGQLLERLREVADVVICDSPQVEPFADALVLSRQVNGVLLVLEAGKTRRNEAKQVVFNLQQAGAELWGVVVGSRHAQKLTADKARKPLPAILATVKESDDNAAPSDEATTISYNGGTPRRRIFG